MNMKLEKYIFDKLSKGIHSFNLDEVRQALGVSTNAVKQALYRYQKKGSISLLRRKFYVIIPPEYAQQGILPIYLFIDDLMKFVGKPYYLALFTAAALHGAAHQQPMESFIITVKPSLRDIKNRKIRLNFSVKNKWDDRDVVMKKTDAGYIPVSSAELTALDLVLYLNRWGINRIIPVVAELVDVMNPSKLYETAGRYATFTAVQRLGFLLDRVFENSDLARPLLEIVKSRKCYYKFRKNFPRK